MPDICILTDTSARFQTPQFPGYQHVHSLPLHVQINGVIQSPYKTKLPVSVNGGSRPKLLPPTLQELKNKIAELSRSYNEIIAILPSANISPSYQFIQTIMGEASGKITLRMIDTFTTSIGLGLLIQAAAQSILAGSNGMEIVRKLREMAQHIYTVFLTRNLTYLHLAGFLDPAQAIVGEMLKLVPLYLFDGQRPICLQKNRNSRQMSNAIIQFVDEFENLAYIGIIRSPQAFQPVVATLMDKLPRQFPSTPLDLHPLETTVSTILGPDSLGIIVMEEAYL